MIALAALLLAQTASADAPAADPPAEWSKLADLPLIRRGAMQQPELSRFVHDEVAAGRCSAAQRGADGFTLAVDLAVLVDRSGEVRRIVPRAIGCLTVEQYAAGLISRMARANLAPAANGAWYRITIGFAWKE